MSTDKALFRQIPIAASAALDNVLSQHRSALQKFRQRFRKQLGAGQAAGEISVGRYGKIVLETTALLPCMQTALRWSADEAGRLCDAYREAGLEKLIKSPEYEQTIALTRDALRNAVREASGELDLPRLVKETVARLAIDKAVVRDVTLEMDRISDVVDQQLAQVRRLPGTLVRFEGPQALVVIEEDDREALRSVNAKLLQAVGIRVEGDPFVLSELRWSPETVSSVFIPAVAVEDEELGEDLAAELTRAQKPLVFPG